MADTRYVRAMSGPGIWHRSAGTRRRRTADGDVRRAVTACGVVLDGYIAGNRRLGEGCASCAEDTARRG